MSIMKVSKKGWVVIPKDIRQRHGIRPGDRVQIIINGISVINGFVDKITASGSLDGHRLNIAGRDKLFAFIPFYLHHLQTSLSATKN